MGEGPPGGVALAVALWPERHGARAGPRLHLFLVSRVLQWRVATPSDGAIALTLPNIITLARLVLVPIVVWALLVGEYVLGFSAFLLAGLSDGVDGWIARQFDQRSELGAWLDPIADKALLVATFVVLGILAELPLWLVVLAVSRDAIILGAVLLATLMANPVPIRPLFVSKANTAAQIALVVWTLADLAWEPGVPAIHVVLVVAVTALTILSGLAYLREWAAHMAGDLGDGADG